MKSVSIRTRLEDKTLPWICFVLVVFGILVKLISELSQHRQLDMPDLLIQVALATGFFYLIIHGRPSLWTISEVSSGIRIERDGAVLYEGPPSGIKVIDEDRGIMTLRSGRDGPSFLFPRRRAFNEFISQIADPKEFGKLRFKSEVQQSDI